MSEWKTMTLGDFVTLHRGYDLPESGRRPGYVPVIGSFGITGYHDTAKVKGPGVTVGRSGASFGVVTYSPVDFWPHNATLFASDFHGNDPKFAFYFLKALDFSRFNSGSAQPSLNRNYIHPIPVTIPPVEEQRAIAHMLGSLDDKIELNRQMNATLEATARAIFKSWFVDFDPVHAKTNGEHPVGMDAEIAALFPDSFEDSALGAIPRGWGIAPLPGVIEINPSRRLRSREVAPYLAMENMPTASARAVAWEWREFGSGMRFQNGDVLFARITPCLENGKTAYVDFLEDDQIAWGSTEYIVFHSKDGLPPEYAYFLARSDELRAFAIQNMTGTSGRQRVPSSAFADYLITVPPREVACRFGEYAKNVMLQMKSHDEQSQTLAELRDALLPKLISGEIRVGEANDIIEAQL